MKIECRKCGFKGEGHQVGRYSIPYVIIQCPECCFIHDIVKLESLIKHKRLHENDKRPEETV